MKFSSIIILLLVITAFVSIQGWVIFRRFGLPEQLEATDAVITSTTTNVSAPSSGTIDELLVIESQDVDEGQTLFVIEPESEEDENQDPIPVKAKRSGIITDIKVEEGEVIQFNEVILSLVDTNPESIYVNAKISVPPNRLAHVQPSLSALVWAKYLNNGQPIEAVIDSVSPQYNAQHQTIDVNLKLSSIPPELENLPIGIPVDVSIKLNNKPQLQQMISKISGIF